MIPTAPTPQTTPVSHAVVPAQPNVAIYGPNDLELFVRFTRSSFAQAFGQDAPTYNPTPAPANPQSATVPFTAKTKNWFDSDAASKADANGNVKYTALSTIQPNPSN